MTDAAVALDRFYRGVTLLSRGCGIVAAGALVAACLAVCHMVFMRYIIEASTVWQTEFVLYSVVAATLLGSPYVLSLGGHVNVDLVSQFLSRKSRLALHVFSSCVALVFCGVLAWSGWQYFHEAWTEGWVTESVWAPPLWIVLIPLPVGIALLCLQYCAEILRSVFGPSEVDAKTLDPDKAR
jgi:TRAP-type C4-dicarboxylate transport system permease small subunit